MAQIVQAILEDSHAVLTVSAWSEQDKVALSLPRVLGRAGVLETVVPTLSEEEKGRFGVVVGYYVGAF